MVFWFGLKEGSGGRYVAGDTDGSVDAGNNGGNWFGVGVGETMLMGDE